MFISFQTDVTKPRLRGKKSGVILMCLVLVFINVVIILGTVLFSPVFIFLLLLNSQKQHFKLIFMHVSPILNKICCFAKVKYCVCVCVTVTIDKQTRSSNILSPVLSLLDENNFLVLNNEI